MPTEFERASQERESRLMGAKLRYESCLAQMARQDRQGKPYVPSQDTLLWCQDERYKYGDNSVYTIIEPNFYSFGRLFYVLLQNDIHTKKDLAEITPHSLKMTRGIGGKSFSLILAARDIAIESL
ncbi:MAG: hypothetical protein UU23_C0001G0109 [Candidatus Curtissbacteria bacterium GW2011_GWA1_40_9]|uniref:Uncharacterized protein n=1 Tax=Candidatus Curtissbacteria bacterium GW2011_GWA1_40_9 TaxID=1618408 RepID=A0A0G0W228_9BACT|nr:MAG: hypothetical protein UU23_C0001G0109 [Candidatus Curtissbacteria bacterium GW2011_GWA1_40_9]